MLEVSDDVVLRISEAVDHLDQANTIFSYVFFALSDFEGFGDPAMDYRLEAMVNVSRLLETLPSTRKEIIAAASREIARRRLPQLLCIALVSAVETCLQDITRMRLRALRAGVAQEAIEREVRMLMSGGPVDYLPRIAERLGISFFEDQQWDIFIELSATRNAVVHRSEPVADERYMRQAGRAARASIGEKLSVDNSYLTTRYAGTKVLMLNLIQAVQGNPKLIS